jgi:PIN domain nuclease of toxin-antitoxin system
MIGADENEVFVSAISALEVATKHRLGNLPEAQRLAGDFKREIEAEGFVPLDVTVDHARLAGALTIGHADPFDRVLIAQSIIERMALISNEAVFDGFGVNRIW